MYSHETLTERGNIACSCRTILRQLFFHCAMYIAHVCKINYWMHGAVNFLWIQLRYKNFTLQSSTNFSLVLTTDIVNCWSGWSTNQKSVPYYAYIAKYMLLPHIDIFCSLVYTDNDIIMEMWHTGAEKLYQYNNMYT